jgi:hypothetical protein
VPALSAVGGLLLVLGLVGLRATWSRTPSGSRRPASTGTARTLDPAHAAEAAGPRRRNQHAGPAVEATASAGAPSGHGRHADADLDDVDEPEEAPAPAPFRQEQRP